MVNILFNFRYVKLDMFSLILILMPILQSKM